MPLGRSLLVLLASAWVVSCLVPDRPKAPTLPTASRPQVVLGYSAAWTDSSYPPAAYDYASLTHIARSFLNPRADGSIAESGGFWNEDLERLAHAHGVSSWPPWAARRRTPTTGWAWRATRPRGSVFSTSSSA